VGRNIGGLKRGGSPGRPKGVPNQASLEAKAGLKSWNLCGPRSETGAILGHVRVRMSPISPARIALLAGLVAIVSACSNGTSPPTSPMTVARPPVPASYTLSGTVTIDGRPAAGVEVRALMHVGSLSTFYQDRTRARVLTDDAGRYQMFDIPAGARMWITTIATAGVPLEGDDVQPCASEVLVQADSTSDVSLVSAGNAAALVAQPPAGRFVSGVIVQTTASGKQAVQDASVVFTPEEMAEILPDGTLLGAIAADTYSDSAGRFIVCGLFPKNAVNVSAFHGGRWASATYLPGQSTIEITLQ
jgi:hypothetical protein